VCFWHSSIPGVPNSTFLNEAVNAVRRYRGETELDKIQFIKMLRVKTKELGMSDEMLKRAVNVGFSGGEKKRNEVLQMAVLEPKLSILDETDSGLDIDALKIVADGVNAMRSPERSSLVITHYQRLLDYIVPDKVHVLAQGRIQRTGGKELALELEEKGYAEFVGEAA
jgi:Fe-S cluster assembly ATP-binding protein